jgi:Domain of unknown function (DUF4396)
MTQLQAETAQYKNGFLLAFKTTLHCLLGCGIGEVLGIIIATAFLLGNFITMIVGISLGFVLGFIWPIITLTRSHVSWKKAFRIILISEGLSIAVMETTQVLMQISMPGAMGSMLTDSIFWWGMLISMGAGFFIALPVNYYLIGISFKYRQVQ